MSLPTSLVRSADISVTRYTCVTCLKKFIPMTRSVWLLFFFFFQAEDGIRDKLVTGVQTCALPIWVLHDLPQDLRRRGTARHLPDFIVRHLDPEPAILTFEQDFLDELVGDLILELLFVFASQPRPGLTARLLDGSLERRLELWGAHRLAVDREDDVASPTKDVRDLAVGQPADEGDCHDEEHRLIDGAHRAHHGTRSSGPGGREGA